MRELIATNSIFMLRRNIYENIQEYEEDFKRIVQEKEQNCWIPFTHQSPQIEFRLFLVKYLKNFCVKKSLSHSCLHLAIYLLDIFMDNHSIVPHRILLVAHVCLLIAAKFEENTGVIPKIGELNALVNNQYTIDDYKKLEVLVLSFFDYYIVFPTAAHYIFYYLPNMINCQDLQENRKFRSLFYDMSHIFTKYLDKTLEDIHFMQCFKPSKLAAAIIAVSRVDVGLSQWTPELETVTGYKIEDIADPIEAFLRGTTLYCQGCRNLSTWVP